MHQLLDFNCAVVLNAQDDIGKAIARYFVSLNKTVLIVGRIETEAQLDSTAREIGASGYYAFDIGNSADISRFTKQVVSKYPELDCIVNNAAVQRPFQALDWSAQTESFVAKANAEIDTQIRGPLQLTMELKTHLQTKRSPVIINNSSLLGFLPFAFVNPIFRGTKAWLHQWNDSLRAQFRRENSPIRVVEIATPEDDLDLLYSRVSSLGGDEKLGWQPVTIENFMSIVKNSLGSG